VHDLVKEYYGKQLRNSEDLRTSACCDGASVPEHLKPILAQIHPEVTERYYGCGLTIPEALEGMRVLDLGCGAGRDCFTLSALVGETGSVVGVDMTEEQLAAARRHADYHQATFGLARPNVTFLHGYLEALEGLPLDPATFDLVVSNCVVNLSPDKPAVFRQAHRLLANGGEMYFSDVYADRRISTALQGDPVLYGECLAGALYWRDFLDMARDAGFLDPRLVRSRPIDTESEELQRKVGDIRFFSATYRLFKVEGLESACEDYGQAVIYRGTVPHHPHRFVLDRHHEMETGRVFPVCGNTWRMLEQSRFGRHFDFLGDGRRHLGIFPGCGTVFPFSEALSGDSKTGGCC
jgi:SAM-dependent methyltransferase